MLKSDGAAGTQNLIVRAFFNYQEIPIFIFYYYSKNYILLIIQHTKLLGDLVTLNTLKSVLD